MCAHKKTSWTNILIRLTLDLLLITSLYFGRLGHSCIAWTSAYGMAFIYLPAYILNGSTLTSLVFICTLEKGGISIDQVCIRRSSASPLRFHQPSSWCIFCNSPPAFIIGPLHYNSGHLLILGHIRGSRWDIRTASLREGIHISEERHEVWRVELRKMEQRWS